MPKKKPKPTTRKLAERIARRLFEQQGVRCNLLRAYLYASCHPLNFVGTLRESAVADLIARELSPSSAGKRKGE